MSRDLARLLAIREQARAFLLADLSFGLFLDGVDVLARFEQLSGIWVEDFRPHLEVLHTAFEAADRERAALPTRDDRDVADAASAMIAVITRLLGDSVPLVLPASARAVDASARPSDEAAARRRSGSG